ncbi:MAG: SGNH/GDSL hydrolase family protein [Rhodobacteraceae bacterium]|nr:SGNH/GDSL hydrolase family protein [Paracoccaceae bacterium]
MSLSIDATVRTALLPLLIAQGALARHRAEDLAEPPGARAGEAGSGIPLSLLITGDSSAAGVGASHQSDALSGHLVRALQPDFRLTWQLEAKTGATSASTLAALEATGARQFDMAVLAVGVNDVTGTTTLSRFLSERRKIYALLRAKFGVGRIIVSGLPPVRHFPLLPQPLRWVMGRQSDRFDAALAAQAEYEDVDYIHFALEYDPALMAVDGFHPAPEAYRLWAHLLAQHIRA